MERLDRILLVDDEADIRTVACLALEDIGGLTVKACKSGAEAMDAVADFAPDLIVLDVMMPVMDGPSTLKALRLRPESARTPVVFFTAKTQRSDIDAFLSYGAVSVLGKPFDPVTLADELRALWAGLAEKAVDDRDACVRVRSKLEDLTAAFLDDAADRFLELRIHIDAVVAATALRHVREHLAAIVESAHKLAGRGGTFGFPDISIAAILLEEEARDRLEEAQDAGPGRVDCTDELRDLTARLEIAIQDSFEERAAKQCQLINR